MAVKQNAADFATEFPKAAKLVNESFYSLCVDDCLTGADSIAEATSPQVQPHLIFSKGGFLLQKWNSNKSRSTQALTCTLFI